MRWAINPTNYDEKLYKESQKIKNTDISSRQISFTRTQLAKHFRQKVQYEDMTAKIQDYMPQTKVAIMHVKD